MREPAQVTVWPRLREAGLTYEKPERRYLEASEGQRREWIKDEYPKIRRSVRRYKALLCFQDETSISLTALLGKTWSRCGKTRIRRVAGKRGRVSAMSAINKRAGPIFALHEKRIASGEVIHFLAQMLAHHKRRRLVAVMDQARPHTCKKTRCFIESQRRLHALYLPRYSSDWNPDEGVWNHLKHEELKGHQVKTKVDMKELAENKLTKMANHPRQLRGIFFRCRVADLLK